MDDSLLYLLALFVVYLLSRLVKFLVGDEAFEKTTTQRDFTKMDLRRVLWREMMLGVGIGDAFGVGKTSVDSYCR